jgi:hypothetical protein
MDAALQAVGSFAAAAFAWVALEFVGRPLRKFFDLRGEIIRRLIEFANIRARWKEMPDGSGAISGEREAVDLSEAEIARLEEARKILRDLASQMRAFAGNETFALYFVHWLNYNPQSASAGLFGLSNSFDTYGEGKAFQRKTLADALRIHGDI